MCSRNSLTLVRRIYTCPVLLYEKPQNLKNKKLSSQQWIVRQLKDPYVEKARQEHYRCRSAFKLIELNEKYKLLQPGYTVVDCGAAPGSWSQVAVRCTNADGSLAKQNPLKSHPIGHVVAMDLLPIYPIEGATILPQCDIRTEEAVTRMKHELNGNLADLVMSDMAPNATGIKDMDHDNIIELVYNAFKFALMVSKVDAAFVAKILDGDKSSKLDSDLSKFYKLVVHRKPKASRDESAEKFVVALGFKGLKNNPSESS